MLAHVEQFIQSELKYLGQLTEDGKKEHFGQAARLFKRHASALTDALNPTTKNAKPRGVVFESSNKPRTVGSRNAFLAGFVAAANISFSSSSSHASINSSSSSTTSGKSSGGKGGGGSKDKKGGNNISPPRSSSDILPSWRELDAINALGFDGMTTSTTVIGGDVLFRGLSSTTEQASSGLSSSSAAAAASSRKKSSSGSSGGGGGKTRNSLNGSKDGDVDDDENNDDDNDRTLTDTSTSSSSSLPGLFTVVTPPSCHDPGDVSSDDSSSTSSTTTGKQRKQQLGEQLAFSKLRFFDSCNAYKSYKKQKGWTTRIERYTANATRTTSHERAMLAQLFKPDHIAALAQVGDGLRLLTATHLPSPSPPATKSKMSFTTSTTSSSTTSTVSSTGGGGDNTLSPSLTSNESEEDASLLDAAEWEKMPPKARKQFKQSRKLMMQQRREQRRLAKAQREGSSHGSTPTIAGLAMDLYSTCQIDLNAYHRSDRFCSVFEGEHLELMAKLELITDLSDFYKQGAGDPLAFAASCILLEDFISTGDAAVYKSKNSKSSSSSPPIGHFRFGHSETVMPFISVMGLYQEPDEASLEDYYHSELMGGTSSLLKATRKRLASLRALHNYSHLSPHHLAQVQEVEEYVAAAAVAATASAVSTTSSSSSSTTTVRSSSPTMNLKASPTGEPRSEESFISSSASTSSSSSIIDLMDPSSRALSQQGNGGFSNWQLMALKHPWSGARLVPMAANIQWLLYDCGDEPVSSSSSSSSSPGDAMRGLWVKMLHNEREIPFPACYPSYSASSNKDKASSSSKSSSSSSSSSSPPLNVEAAKYGLTMPCPWETVKAFFRGPVYERYGINTCSPSDWIEMCSGFDDIECERSSGTVGVSSSGADE
jgi:hypothetical protein